MGRRELAALDGLEDLPIASLVVIKGRWRIGKSRLADEFSRPFRTLRFMGLAPEDGISARASREHFANQLKRQLSFASVKADDWNDLFALLAAATGEGLVVVILDEINWMGSKDRTFLPKLKSAWDLKSGQRSKLCRFRLSDNYLRFYLRYIEPNRKAIETSGSIHPPAWHTIMGLQFENLALNHLLAIFRMPGIDPADIVQTGPFF